MAKVAIIIGFIALVIIIMVLMRAIYLHQNPENINSYVDNFLYNVMRLCDPPNLEENTTHNTRETHEAIDPPPYEGEVDNPNINPSEPSASDLTTSEKNV